MLRVAVGWLTKSLRIPPTSRLYEELWNFGYDVEEAYWLVNQELEFRKSN